MKKLLALSLLVLLPKISEAQRDTTIYTATRIITSTTGKITSVSVVKTGIPVGTTKPDTVRITKTDTLRLTKTDTLKTTYYFAPRIVQDSLIFYDITPTFPGWPNVYRIPLRFSSIPSPAIHDTVIVIKHDTVYQMIPGNCCSVIIPSNPPGLHIFDIPSRVGELNVYNDSTYLGRLMWQDNQPGKIWFAFQFKLGDGAMSMLPLAYSDSLSAMSYLLHPDNPPPNPITLNPRVPQMPNAILKPN